MMRAAILWLCLLAPGAWAQSLPALYDVSGVRQGDTLNVRAGPSTDFEVIGKLPADATGLEVIDADPDGAWGLINWGEGAGWVALGFLSRQPGQPEEGLPAAFVCSGTEPFWSFGRSADGKATLSRPDREAAFESLQTLVSENRPDRHALFADGGDTVVTAIVARNLCRDGMTERAYGLGIDLLVTDKTEVHVYSGCCRVGP